MSDDLRGFLKVLEERGLLHRVACEVDWDTEIGTVQRRVADQDGPALLFERVRGSEWPVVSGVLGTPERYALAVGSAPDVRSIICHVKDASQRSIAPVVIGAGPCQEHVDTGAAIDLGKFPAPRWHELDGGRYIGTLGLVITKDPDSGERNIGIYREQIMGRDRIALNATQQVGTLWQKWRRQGKPMPLATAIGVDPCTLAASCVHAPLGLDEFGISGALRGRPLQLARCVSQDLEVPATAEIVLEGEIAPDAPLVDEGPFGEFAGYYGVMTKSPLVTLTAVTHRDRPILQGALTGMPPTEDTTLRVMGHSAGDWAKLERLQIPGVKDFYETEMGCANYMVVVSMSKQYYHGQAKQVIAGVWANIHIAKWVVVVNDDVDIYDRAQVEWAISTRVAPYRDIWVTPQNQPDTNLDPAIHPDDRTYPYMRGSRVGIDATVDFKGFEYPPMTTPSPEAYARVDARWREYGLP